jgi:hypothetical protein
MMRVVGRQYIAPAGVVKSRMLRNYRRVNKDQSAPPVSYDML